MNLVATLALAAMLLRMAVQTFLYSFRKVLILVTEVAEGAVGNNLPDGEPRRQSCPPTVRSRP